MNIYKPVSESIELPLPKSFSFRKWGFPQSFENLQPVSSLYQGAIRAQENRFEPRRHRRVPFVGAQPTMRSHLPNQRGAEVHGK